MVSVLIGIVLAVYGIGIVTGLAIYQNRKENER